MTDAERCFVAGCDRRSAVSVNRTDLPGPLRLCMTHTEQFRQSSESWGITWPPGDPGPSSVTAPGNDVLWAYQPPPRPGPDPLAPGHDPGRRGLLGFPGRAAGWIEARRGGRDNSAG